MKKKTIRLIAAIIIACMFIIVPSTMELNGSNFGFAYRFIWDLDRHEDEVMSRTVDAAYQLVQIIGVLAIAWLITKDMKR
ncbi:hypothetical protein PO654_16640 [Phytobacter diazotrophicus]|uniref:hypothetical protein n=1 Tax=Phytobacter diazotrophicus TaxID=395631 RepID=UPI0013EDA756|nr:hypothetical protein [Phytobacter diazotrophicus]MDU6685345.1 hypothetical protein [Enterobacteriaceae bacterium]QIH65042.1 hypothetical protein CRX67_19230 [Enterobacteriaceae bacterium A-F18]